MSFTATPSVGPVRVSDADVDAALKQIGVPLVDTPDEPEAAGSPDADPGEDQQATSEPQTEEPHAGDEQAEDADPDPQPEEPPKYRVKVRGAEVEVPLPELLNGYSRTEDYKAKTAEIAEQRRALEREKADFTARMAQLNTVLEQAPTDPVIAEGQKTDWVKLAQEDPAGYVARYAAFQQRVAAYQQVATAREQAQRDQFAKEWQRTEEELARELPEWRTEEGKKTAKARIVSTARAYGIPDEIIAGINSPAVIRALNDAAAYREAQLARQSAETKRAPAPAPQRVIRPGTPPAKSAPSRALLNQARNGRLDDSVDAVMRLLNG